MWRVRVVAAWGGCRPTRRPRAGRRGPTGWQAAVGVGHGSASEEQARERVAHRVDQDGERCPDRRHQPAPEQRAARLRHRGALLEPRVRPRQESARQQPWQEGLVGGGVEHRQQAEHRHQRSKHGDRQDAREGEQGHPREHDRPAEVRADQQRLAADPVGQHAGEQSDRQVGGNSRGLDEPNVGRRAAQVGDDEHTERDTADGGTECGDRGRRPEPAKTRVVAQSHGPVRHPSRPATGRG